MNLEKILDTISVKSLVIATFCLFSFSFTLKAQVVIMGRITDVATYSPLYPATILDKTSGEVVYADSSGYYRIAAQGGDELQYSYLGFYTVKYTVPKYLTNVIHDVQLVSKREKLQEVEVRAMTPYQKDSLNRMKTFHNYLDKPVYQLFDKHAHSNGGFGLTLHPFTYFSKKEQLKRHFHKMYPKFEQEAFINSRYTPKLIHQLTGLSNDSLQLFMYHYRPSYEFTRRASDLEFWSWIKIQYKSWIMPK